jgi:hypothetical protein
MKKRVMEKRVEVKKIGSKIAKKEKKDRKSWQK